VWFYKNGRNKCELNFDEMNVSILLGDCLVVPKRGCDKWGCRGKGNLSDGKSFFHKTSLLQPLQLSAECYADKSAILFSRIGYEGKTITKQKPHCNSSYVHIG